MPKQFPIEFRQRALRLLAEARQQQQYETEWPAIQATASRLGVNSETLSLSGPLVYKAPRSSAQPHLLCVHGSRLTRIACRALPVATTSVAGSSARAGHTI